ncbi:MAG: Rieske 2Fe-2S domain-containing protein [Actinobacteria bacterium]|nr:Rieske 2Fe-2S domain-containing protein [Actinomycetota bacterium]
MSEPVSAPLSEATAEATAEATISEATTDAAAAESLSRRSFLTYLLGLAAALGAAGLAFPIARFAYPVKRVEVQPKLRVASLSALTPLGDAVVFDYQDASAGLILLEDGTPKAFYLACTHFGCLVKWRTEEQDWYCPCHAGIFAPDGAVLAGPPPSPLVELRVVAEGDDLFVEGTVG